MRFKVLFTLLLTAITYVGYCQNKAVVLKKCLSEKSEGFPSNNYTCQKLYFVDGSLVCKVNLSNNGWQIIDSITYQNEGGKLCVKTFQPLYDVENKMVRSYDLFNVESYQTNESFFETKDKYNLSKEYLFNLDFLLSKKPEKTEWGYFFNFGFIPSLFTQYGIPANEILKTFNFIIEDSIVISDSFIYENFILFRNYEYLNDQLKSVVIFIKDRNGKIIFHFKEVYELV